MIVCPSCRNYVGLSASGGPPPWCPKCGADLKGAPSAPPPQAPAPPPMVQPVGEGDPQLPQEQLPVVTVQKQPSAPTPHTPSGMRRMPPLPYEEPPTKPKEPSVAWWAILFAIACGLIPVISLGGAIPAIIGFGGASLCLGASKLRDLPTTLRIGICVSVTVAAWLVFIAFIGFMSSMMGTHPGYQPRYRR